MCTIFEMKMLYGCKDVELTCKIIKYYNNPTRLIQLDIVSYIYIYQGSSLHVMCFSNASMDKLPFIGLHSRDRQK